MKVYNHADIIKISKNTRYHPNDVLLKTLAKMIRIHSLTGISFARNTKNLNGITAIYEGQDDCRFFGLWHSHCYIYGACFDPMDVDDIHEHGNFNMM